WTRHIRETVRYHHALETLHETGVAAVLVEVGPDAALSASTPSALPLLRRNRDERLTLLTALAAAHAHGSVLDWSAFQPGRPTHADGLPTYPFRHRRHWLNAPAHPGRPTTGHALLFSRIELAEDGGLVLPGHLSPGAHPWLEDHRIAGRVLVPGTLFLDLALTAGEQSGTPRVEELTLEAPLVLAGDRPVRLQLSVGAADASGARPLSVHARASSDDAGTDTDTGWTRHATGLLAPARTAPAGGPAGAWPPSGAEPVDADALYEDLDALGYAYGPAFKGVRAAWRRGEELYAELALPGLEAEGFCVHPALLDAALHLPVARAAEDGADGLPLPFSWSGVQVHATGASVLRVRWAADGSLTAVDPEGRPVVTADALALLPVDVARLGSAAERPRDLHRVVWETVAPAAGSAGTVAFVGSLGDVDREDQ
ncbi:polyketide synthase dehydratase domain-containing protein, partial [Streptomyces sp. NPDC059072]